VAARRRVIALLRGVNVGGRTVPMADLRAGLEAGGATGVASYLQSGNVAFDTTLALDDVAPFVSDTVARTAGVEGVAVVVRTAADLERIVEGTPYPVDRPKALHVAFLAPGADRDALAGVDPDRFGTDRFCVVDDHVYLWLPDGVGRTKANNDFWERTARVPSTMRNWTTVSALSGL
jgi:uncharacterized protein (DUF1697 family)